jgi:hypothetical protein
MRIRCGSLLGLKGFCCSSRATRRPYRSTSQGPSVDVTRITRMVALSVAVSNSFT